MSSPSFEETSDWEKLTKAMSTLTGLFTSFDDMLEAFGLAGMPAAQRYGIFFGFCVFVGTVIAVLFLLVKGGSFQRMAEQSNAAGMVRIPDVTQARTDRPLLYDHYLEARDRMVKNNYPPVKRSTEATALTKMILNPPIRGISDLIDEDDEKNGSKNGNKKENAEKKKQKKNGNGNKTADRWVPDGFEEDYKEAYLKCLEKPWGTILSGKPECRFEAYARSFASTGRFVNRDYRRSYSRVYESQACSTHDNEEKFRKLYAERPDDLVGKLVRLEALEVKRHLETLFDFTCGDAYLENKPFAPNRVWGFFDYGPFKDDDELKNSPVFQRLPNEAAFAVVENVTNRFVGVVTVANDHPQNLSIDILPPIFSPSHEESTVLVEAFFMVMDKLFALGYRRVQLTVDTQDASNKRLAATLGFTKEAEIPKHMVVKNANRDSIIYGMLNTDWNKGARSFLFKKVHGERALKRDRAYNKKEGEMEEQMDKVARMKKLEKKVGKTLDSVGAK